MKIHADILEEEALNQFKSAMKMPFVVDGALMPDAHTGYSLPIGAVVATKDYIVPAWVGYDIGCGMCALKLDIEDGNINIPEVFNKILEEIPVGFNQYKEPQKIFDSPHTRIVDQGLNKRGVYQLGTLGGGNHFIEIGIGQDSKLWIIVHSGSRNLGHHIASHYMKLAYVNNIDIGKYKQEFAERNTGFKEHNPKGYEKAMKKYVDKQVDKIKNAKLFEGHYAFNVDSQEGKDYILDMNYCLEYALENRKRMIYKISEIMGNPTQLEFINRNHNHADLKDGLWYHRKGATHAEKGMHGVVPGNMKDGSFITIGKGNPDFLYSSSHGAGRILSRKKAKESLNVEIFKNDMKGICGIVNEDTLDESPNAYKNIFDVMKLQEDSVDVVDYVKPIINVKG